MEAAEVTFGDGRRFEVATMRGVAFYLRGWAARRWEPDEGEWADDVESGLVRAVMVGDDYEHTVDVAGLTEINDDDYCAGCGQIGCHAYG